MQWCVEVKDDALYMLSKVKMAGDRVEVVNYSSPIACGFERLHTVHKRTSGTPEDRREDNLYRSRKNLRELIWANEVPYMKFITLTYAEVELAVDVVRCHIRSFVKAMRRSGYEMRYVYVLENQLDRGRKEGNEGCLHVHMLIFNSDYLDFNLLNKCWKHGTTHIQAIDHVRNAGAYVCKYITKQGSHAFGSQVYGCSNGLKRPAVERFYTDGLSDHTIGLHPNAVVLALDVEHRRGCRHDFRAPSGELKSMGIEVIQGKWKGGNIIEQNAED